MRAFEREAGMRVYSGLSDAILAEHEWHRPPACGSAARIAAGVAIYRNNVRAGALKILRESLPVVERLVGEEFFQYLAREYFLVSASESPMIARYADGAPSFIERFEPAAGVPYLADVARLELAWLGAYHAAEATSLPADAVFDGIGRAFDAARFDFHPSMRLLSSDYPVCSIWEHNRRKNGALLDLSGGEKILVIRPAGKVLVETISPEFYDLLAMLAAGLSLGEGLARASVGEDCASTAAMIGKIAACGAVVGFRDNL